MTESFQTTSTLVLRLNRGRVDPNEEMTDEVWNTTGPTLGPLRSVHGVYTTHLILNPAIGNDVFLDYFDDLVYYDGYYYSDWTIGLRRDNEVVSYPQADKAINKDRFLYIIDDYDITLNIGSRSKHLGEKWAASYSGAKLQVKVLKDQLDGADAVSVTVRCLKCNEHVKLFLAAEELHNNLINGTELLFNNEEDYIWYSTNNCPTCYGERPLPTLIDDF